MTNKEKLKVLYKLARKIIKKPSSIFLILKDETEFEQYLKKKYGKTQFATTDLTQFLIQNKAVVDNYTFLDGSSLVTDLALLRSLASSFESCEYLEIGTWRGESLLNVAAVANHCTSINLSPDDIIAMGLPEKYARLHGCLLKDQTNIKTIHANSRMFNFNSLNQKYDLIFIDGDHSYEGVKSDTEKVFSLLNDENSIIVWHDYGYNPEHPRHSVIAAIWDGLPVEDHKYLYHVSNTMCAIYTKKKLNAKLINFPVSPDKTFEINIVVSPFDQKN